MIQDFYFTQTNVKDFENELTCPFRWKAQWVDREFTLPSSMSMDKGKYFEWLFIGGSAIAGDSVTDLPRLKNGEKSVDQLRIEEQAERAKNLFIPGNTEFLGLKMLSTQLELKSSKGRKGTLDILAEDITTKDLWIIDVKLTADLTSRRTQYSWGHPWEDLDLLQQIHYEALYEEQFGVRPRMGLLVFDYSPHKRLVFGEIIITDTKRLDKELRFQAAEEAFQLYEKHGWIKLPSVKECSTCPLNCSSRIKLPINENV